MLKEIPLTQTLKFHCVQWSLSSEIQPCPWVTKPINATLQGKYYSYDVGFIKNEIELGAKPLNLASQQYYMSWKLLETKESLLIS